MLVGDGAKPHQRGRMKRPRRSGRHDDMPIFRQVRDRGLEAVDQGSQFDWVDLDGRHNSSPTGEQPEGMFSIRDH